MNKIFSHILKVTFSFRDWKRFSKIYLSTKIETHFTKLLETLKNCLQPNPYDRPNCEQLLKMITEFDIEENILQENKTVQHDYLELIRKQQIEFLYQFFTYKFLLKIYRDIFGDDTEKFVENFTSDIIVDHYIH